MLNSELEEGAELKMYDVQHFVAMPALHRGRVAMPGPQRGRAMVVGYLWRWVAPCSGGVARQFLCGRSCVDVAH